MFVNDDWQPVEAAVKALGLMVAPVLPTITHGIRLTGHAEMEEALSNLRGKP